MCTQWSIDLCLFEPLKYAQVSLSANCCMDVYNGKQYVSVTQQQIVCDRTVFVFESLLAQTNNFVYNGDYYLYDVSN